MHHSTCSLDDCLKIGPDVVFRDLDGEAVILNLETGIYFGLNEAGTRMWNLIVEEQGSLRKVFERMLQEYDVPPDALERDLCELAYQLHQKKLVVAIDAN